MSQILALYWVVVCLFSNNALAQSTASTSQQWPSASTLVVTATTCSLTDVACSNTVATYTAVRSNDTGLWNITIPTTIHTGPFGLTIDPLGYLWAGPSGVPNSALPAIPSNAPHAYPNGLAFACDATGVCTNGLPDSPSTTERAGLPGGVTTTQSRGGGSSILSSLTSRSPVVVSSTTNSTPINTQATSTSTDVGSSSTLGPTSSLSSDTSITVSSTSSFLAAAPPTSIPTAGSSPFVGSAAPPNSTTSSSFPNPATGPITIGPSNANPVTQPSSSSSLSTPTVPFGVFLTTISGSSYTLTYVSTTATAKSTIVETFSGTTTTDTVIPGGPIWVVPTLPPQLPQDVGPIGPPPGAPKPSGGGGPPFNLLCLFGCGPGGGGGSGSGSNFPCIINCGGGRGGGEGGGSDGKPTDSNPSETTTRSTTESSLFSTSSCTTTSAPNCDETVFLTTSYYSDSSTSTVISSTSTRCVTVTACNAQATTATVTSSTSTSEPEYICAPTSCAGSCKRKRGTSGVITTNAYKHMIGLAAIANVSHDQDEPVLSKPKVVERTLPAPSSDETIDKFISNIFDSGQVFGAGAGGPLLADFDEDKKQYATSRYDAFGDKPFSSGVDGLFGCISIVIVSRKGVWTSHFWQGTFSGSLDNNVIKEAFVKEVLNPLSRSQTEFIALTDVPTNAFAASEHPQLLIISPGSTKVRNSPPKYARAVSEITAEVTRLVPALGISNAQTLWTYQQVTNAQFKSGALKGNALGKVLTNYDPSANAEGAQGYQVWGESDVAIQDIWGTGCNTEGDSTNNDGSHRKRQKASACSLSKPSGASSTSASATTLSTLVSSSVEETRSSISEIITTTSSTALSTSSMTTIPGSTTTSSGPNTTTRLCYPYQNPRAGPDKQGCQCTGLEGLAPFLTNTASTTPFNICGYTAVPTLTTTSVMPFTSTDSQNGFVYRCASSSYYNMAVNTILECAGSSTVVSTVMTIYTAYAASIASVASVASASSVSSALAASSASVASASAAAAASSSAAVAKPAAKCLIWDSISHYTLQVYGIKGWGGDGSSLLHEEKGCGALTAWTWGTGCDGETSQASFTLPFLIKAGCVERAIRSAGGPAGLACEGGGMAFTGTEDKQPCHQTGMSLGSLIEKGMNLQRKMKTSDLAVVNKAAVANDTLEASSVLTATTTHLLAQPGNTAAVAALAALSDPASASATATSV